MLLDVLFGEAILNEESLDVVTVVSLELEDLSRLFVVDDATVAIVRLESSTRRRASASGDRVRRRGGRAWASEQTLTFLTALTIFLRSSSGLSPATVVIDLRPLRC